MYPGKGTVVLIRPAQTFYERINLVFDDRHVFVCPPPRSYGRLTYFLYLRDHKNSFAANSILLTTLTGNAVRPSDEGTQSVSTVADMLVTVLFRMNDYLQNHPDMPEVKNPVLATENFSRHWDQRRYADFRKRVQAYAQTAKQAKAEPSAEKAIKLWQELFGDSFC